MKKLIGALTLFCTTTGISAQNAPGRTEMTMEFRQNAQKWVNAYNSKDANNLAPLYSEDAQYISSHVAGLVAEGRQKIIANFQNGMNEGGHIDSIEILTVNNSCDLATLLCKYQATNNGQTVIGRNLLVLKKIRGVWLIILHMTVV